jgi:hypothetical protein
VTARVLTAARVRTFGRVLAMIAVVVLVLGVRVVTASRGELEDARRHAEGGRPDLAIVHYRRAASWYAPGNPYSSNALDELAELAAEYRRNEDFAHALAAWRAVRGAILSTRSFYTPNGDLLDRANGEIADITASLDPPPVDRGKPRERVRAEHLALLEESHRPHVGWSFVLLAGFVMWVGGVFAITRFAIDEEDRWQPRPLRLWGLVVVVGLGLFALGMALA